MRVLRFIITFIIVSLMMTKLAIAQQQVRPSCLFKNPLCFYATDILSYIQILHKNSRYEEMLPFLYEPQQLTKIGKNKAIADIEKMNIGYEMKRVGIRELSRGKKWIVTYQRIIMGTAETFTIHCGNIQDTTRLLMNSTQRKLVFYPKRP